MRVNTRTMPSTAMSDADTANGERHVLDDERRCAHALAEQAVRDLVADLVERELTMATAESLTGGLASLLIARVPDSGAVHRGGVVAYSPEVKRSLLGVSPGPVVTARCAREMAAGVQRLLDVRCSMAFTGVAGPTTLEGNPVGTVFVAARFDDRASVLARRFAGTPEDVRSQAVGAGATLLAGLIDDWESKERAAARVR